MGLAQANHAVFRVFFSCPLGHASVRPPQEICSICPSNLTCPAAPSLARTPHIPAASLCTVLSAHPRHHHVSRCCCCISTPSPKSALWPPLTRFPPTAEHPSRTRATTRSVLAPRLHPVVLVLPRHGLISTTTNGSRPYLITTTLFRFVIFRLPYPECDSRARAFPTHTPGH